MAQQQPRQQHSTLPGENADRTGLRSALWLPATRRSTAKAGATPVDGRVPAGSNLARPRARCAPRRPGGTLNARPEGRTTCGAIRISCGRLPLNVSANRSPTRTSGAA